MPLDPGRSIAVAEAHPANRGVLAHLRARTSEGAPLTARPGDVPSPYLGLGAHPDVVERVWDQLGWALSEDCRCIVHGTPALVDPGTGLVLALALGTSYVLRIAPADLEGSLAAGARTTHAFAGGGTLDLATFGPGWVFGRFAAIEADQLAAARAHASHLGDRDWAS